MFACADSSNCRPCCHDSCKTTDTVRLNFDKENLKPVDVQIPNAKPPLQQAVKEQADRLAAGAADAQTRSLEQKRDHERLCLEREAQQKQAEEAQRRWEQERRELAARNEQDEAQRRAHEEQQDEEQRRREQEDLQRREQQEVEQAEKVRELKGREAKAFLLTHGFSGNNVNEKKVTKGLISSSFHYPLHAAVKMNDAEAVQCLLWSGADRTLPDSKKLRPLELAHKLEMQKPLESRSKVMVPLNTW